jgi:hypothetical protein
MPTQQTIKNLEDTSPLSAVTATTFNEPLRRAQAIVDNVRLKAGEEPLTMEEIVEECHAVRQERYTARHGQPA